MDIFVGFPGRAHDANVFKNNPLYRHLPDIIKKTPFRPLIESYHIVGDSAFPLSPQLLTPFKKPPNKDLNGVQKKYNRNLSSKRSVCSDSYGHFMLSSSAMCIFMCTAEIPYYANLLQNIERSFALLLQRFPRIRLLNQKKLTKKIKAVMSSCILHNICILENDNIEYFL